MSAAHHELTLDAVLASTGPRIQDDLAVQIPIRSLLGPYARPDGLLPALIHGPVGEEVAAIRPFIPGLDDGTNLDIPTTIGERVPQARKMLDQGSPNTLHVILDVPERQRAATGDYAPRSVATYTLALCGHLALAAGSDLMVYRNDGDKAGLMFEGPASDLFSAFNQLSGRTRRRDIQSTKDTSLNGLLRIARSRIDPEENVAVVVSDFLDGYSAKSERFDWESSLKLMANDMNDRLRAVRMQSPSQLEVPLGLAAPLSLTTISRLNHDFSATAHIKDAHITNVLKDIPHQEIEMFRDDQHSHPVRLLSQFVVGSSRE